MALPTAQAFQCTLDTGAAQRLRLPLLPSFTASAPTRQQLSKCAKGTTAVSPARRCCCYIRYIDILALPLRCACKDVAVYGKDERLRTAGNVSLP